MAKRFEPDIEACRQFAEQFDRSVVVTFSIEPNGERFHVTTYGKTRQLCKLAASFGDRLADAVRDGTIAAPEVEPPGEPCARQSWVRIADDD